MEAGPNAWKWNLGPSRSEGSSTHNKAAVKRQDVLRNMLSSPSPAEPSYALLTTGLSLPLPYVTEGLP